MGHNSLRRVEEETACAKVRRQRKSESEWLDTAVVESDSWGQDMMVGGQAEGHHGGRVGHADDLY